MDGNNISGITKFDTGDDLKDGEFKPVKFDIEDSKSLAKEPKDGEVIKYKPELTHEEASNLRKLYKDFGTAFADRNPDFDMLDYKIFRAEEALAKRLGLKNYSPEFKAIIDEIRNGK